MPCLGNLGALIALGALRFARSIVLQVFRLEVPGLMLHACMHACRSFCHLKSKLCAHGAPGDDGDSDSSGSESSDSESETRLNMHAWSGSLFPACFPPYAAACMHAKLGR